MGFIIFNGRSSKDIDLEVERFPKYETPQKVLDVISVPGRNGDLIVDTGKYRNVPRTYQVSIATFDRTTYSRKMSQVAEWLYSASGYARLEDSYDEDFYRLAYYGDRTSIENLFNEAGRATISFVCKPERYYKKGEFPVIFNTDGTIQNETLHESYPLLKIITDNTAGEVIIGEYHFGILAGSGTHIDVDCELQDAYYNGESKNNFINLNGGNFPVIDPGVQIIAFTGGVQSVEVIPRWWTV